jgi:hypothetical protein
MQIQICWRSSLKGPYRCIVVNTGTHQPPPGGAPEPTAEAVTGIVSQNDDPEGALIAFNYLWEIVRGAIHYEHGFGDVAGQLITNYAMQCIQLTDKMVGDLKAAGVDVPVSIDLTP